MGDDCGSCRSGNGCHRLVAVADPVPYSLHKTPAVKVSVRAVESDYPDVKETADDVELLVKVYVQRPQANRCWNSPAITMTCGGCNWARVTPWRRRHRDLTQKMPAAARDLLAGGCSS